MNWTLSEAIMDVMPQWVTVNEHHALARHLLTLSPPPQEEADGYKWIETEASLARSVGITTLASLKPVLEALHLSEKSLTDSATFELLKGKGLPSARATLFWQELMQSST